MRKILFWTLYMIGQITMKRILFFIIVLVMGLLLVGAFSSCTTTKGALNKIAEQSSKGTMTAAERKQFAAQCATEFPAIEFTSEGTKTSDSSKYVAEYKALEKAYQDAGNDVQNLVNMLDAKGQDNDVLREMLYDAKRKADSLSIAKNVYKKVPCPETLQRDTTYKVSVYELEQARITVNQLRQESAGKDIVIEQEKARADEAEKKTIEAGKKLWKVGGIAFGSGIVLAFLIGLFLKLKSII